MSDWRTVCAERERCLAAVIKTTGLKGKTMHASGKSKRLLQIVDHAYSMYMININVNNYNTVNENPNALYNVMCCETGKMLLAG